ncbi:hypothetical protein [Stieleria maiorica]|uniref:hypothetical protein n=1 Tax=Stieleria maiorica TaxID=2795974 RepID=UPI0011CBF005|nr:hypothetical protein [Stieleria maiorica]
MSCARDDANLKTGTCLEVCEFTAEYSKSDLDEMHPSTRLSSFQSGAIEYASYIAFLSNHFDVDLTRELMNLTDENGSTASLGECTLKDFADAIDRLRRESRVDAPPSQ